MEALAALLGGILARVLAYCAPVIVEILREAAKDTVENGAVRDDLRERLLERVRNSRCDDTTGRASTPARDDSKDEGMGGGSWREGDGGRG